MPNDREEYQLATRDVLMFNEREIAGSDLWQRIVEVVTEEEQRRIDQLIADDDGAEANRGRIDALRFVKGIPALMCERAEQIMGDYE